MNAPAIGAAFPKADETVDREGIRSSSYRRGGTEIKVSSIPPGAVVPTHAHPEVQLGFILSGHLQVTVGDVTRRMRPRQDCYIAPPDVPHAAVNDSGAEVLAVDVKRLEPEETYTAPEAFFLAATGDPAAPSFRHDWLAVTVIDLPPGQAIAAHHHDREEQLGVCLEGSYAMTVDDATVTLTPGAAYLCLAEERHEATNPFDAPATFLQIALTPPRTTRG